MPTDKIMTTRKSRFEVQHTGKPFAQAIPDNAWKTLSYHRTPEGAFRRIDRERAHLGPFEWDNHYRVIDRKNGRTIEEFPFEGAFGTRLFYYESYNNPLSEKVDY